MVLAHMGPFDFLRGQALSAEMIRTVLLRTDVRAAISKRGQWGGGLCFILEGLAFRLAQALTLVRKLMAEHVGGDGHDDDPRQPPRGRKDAWSEACSEDGRLDDQAAEGLTADGWAGESHDSEGEAGEMRNNQTTLLG